MDIVPKFISRNYTKGRGGITPNQITPHTAVAKVDSLYAWFNNPNTRSSTHFYVNGKGVIEQYVSENDTAWSNANWNSNLHSITYETWDNAQPWDATRTNEMYEGAAQLTAYLAKKWNIPLILLSKSDAIANKPGITLHKYYASTSCPAALDVNRIINRAKEINNSVIDSTMTTLNPEKFLIKCVTLNSANANVRKEPTTTSAVVRLMPPHTKFTTNKIVNGQSVSQNNTTTDLWFWVGDGWFGGCWVAYDLTNSDELINCKLELDKVKADLGVCNSIAELRRGKLDEIDKIASPGI